MACVRIARLGPVCTSAVLPRPDLATAGRRERLAPAEVRSKSIRSRLVNPITISVPLGIRNLGERCSSTLRQLRARIGASRMRWLLLPIPVLYFALIAFPPPPGPIGTGLDQSFMIGLNMAHQQGLVAGKDLHWTYGPLGYLIFPDASSGQSDLVWIFRLGVYSLWVVAMLWLVLTARSKAIALWAVAVLGTAAVLDRLLSPDRLQMASLTVALFPLARRSRLVYAETAVLGALSGIALLCRFDLGIESAILFCCVLGFVLWRDWPLRPRQRWHAITAGLSLPFSAVAFYVLATGHIVSFVPYIRYSFEVASGYSENMSVPGPMWQVSLAIVSIAGLLMALPAVSLDMRALLKGWIFAAVICFLAFKHGMVRQDPPHAAPFQIWIALASLFMLFSASNARDRGGVMLFQIFSLFLGAQIFSEMSPDTVAAVHSQTSLESFWRSAPKFLHWSTTWKATEIQQETLLEPLRLDSRFRDLIKRDTVDAVPYNVAQIEANHFNWRPQPVFQTYVAHTPTLDQMNSQFLRSSSAARYILLGWFAVDGRHPFFEAPASWRAILDWYDVVAVRPELWLLKRRSTARYGALQQVGATLTRLGDSVRVPSVDGLLLMSAGIGKSTYGSVRNLLYRLDPIYVDVTFRSGRMISWRVVRANLVEGVVVNNLPLSLYDLTPILHPEQPVADPVASIRFRPVHADQFERDVPIRWYSVKSRDAVAGISIPKRRPRGRLTSIWDPTQPPPSVSGAITVRGTGSFAVKSTTIDPQITFLLPAALSNCKAIVIRARFDRLDRLDFFFGKQVDGRGLSGYVPRINEWVDVFIPAANNPYWQTEHGATLRFDPASESGIGNRVDIAGIWAFEGDLPADMGDFEFYELPRKEADLSRYSATL